MLVVCSALEEKRTILKIFWGQQSHDNSQLGHLLEDMLSSHTPALVQFLLDPSVLPQVIAGCQKELNSIDEIFRLTSTYCYGLHRRRLQLNGRFNSRTLIVNLLMLNL
jgi:hypothetical protein